MHSWALCIPVSLSLVLLLYWRGWKRVHVSFPGVLRMWRAVAFVTGALVLGVTLVSPLAMLDHRYLTVHMVRHLMILTVAAPLMLLGAPVVILMHLLPPGIVGQLARRLGLAHPIGCWIVGIAVVVGWHVPGFALGMQSEAWHAVEQASFLAAGILFWWPVIQPWPAVRKWSQWSIPVYLLLAALPCDALSGFLCLSNRVVYPHYALPGQRFDLIALQDQACAGALLWLWVTFAYLFPAAAVTFRLLTSQKRVIEEPVA